jgi:hypothetical protein
MLIDDREEVQVLRENQFIWETKPFYKEMSKVERKEIFDYLYSK